MPQREKELEISPAARTVYFWGFYAFGVGLVLLLVPNVLLELLRVPPTDEPWIRGIGVVAIALGVYFVAGARSEATSFLKGTVLGRFIVATGATVLFALWGYWLAILFGLAEAAGALWTWSALRREKPAPATTPAT